MKRSVLLAVGVVVVLIVGWLALGPGGDEVVVVDLIDEFDNAIDKRPNPETFEVIDATIAGQTRRAIYAKGPSRLVYRVVVPENGELRTAIGMLEEGWTVPGDGVLFRILIASGGVQETLYNLVYSPYENPGDRGWHEVALDLSEYEGETVELFFNTNSSGPSTPPVDHRDGDMPVWGEPRLVTRR
ncbi:MAG: hypothetical protein DIU54_008175 [Acidobacteriota bacterium]|jgi:hypothetical protein|nr:MAG: hypothetical protein DIU54_14955 [Acidobacteriota bacterium]